MNSLYQKYQELAASRKTSHDVLADQKANNPYEQAQLEQLLQSPLLEGYTPLVAEDPMIQRLDIAHHIMKKSANTTLKPLLPLLLSIRGKPYHLHDHFPFAPFFRTRMAKKVLLKTGRQVSKSTSLAAQGVLFSNCIPYFSTLYITPLFEMIRRFSQNYVAPFIETSPVRRLFSGVTTTNNVLQRSFKNRSQMIFSFAYLDAERTRGISADKNCVVTGTLVELKPGVFAPIEKTKPGMPVVSADKHGNLIQDTIIELLNQGYQHVYEVEFSNGYRIECTADERFRQTKDGKWIYLSEIVPEATTQGPRGRLTEEANRCSLNVPPEAADIGLFVRRRGNPKATRTLRSAACEEATIRRVTYTGKKQTWDLNVGSEHAFFGNGVQIHNCIDEVQDMDITFLPIIHETISASRDWGLIHYAGTPKTLDNTIEQLWSGTSQAEWMIKCHHPGCSHWNVPSLDYDLTKMIGPVHDAISEQCPGVICAKCAKPLNPRPKYQGGHGRWVHRNPDLRWDFAGYHVPQIIMPMHYASREKWQTLVDKMNGKGRTSLNVFYNEVCGESWDSGSKLVTDTDLRKAARLPWHCRVEEAKQHCDEYLMRVCAVDWGGGGVKHGKSDFNLQSYTSIAVLGLCPDGRVDVIYGYRSMNPHNHVREARVILGVMSAFRCEYLVHDYTGAGTVRETVVRQAGLPLNRILPISYIGTSRTALINFRPATELHPRDHYTMDRNRALSYCCQFIKSGIIRFFRYDYNGPEDPGLLRDFLNLIEDKKESGSGRDSYKILRDPAGPDDFAQAVTMGTMMLFQLRGQWPDLSAYEDVGIPEEVYLSTRDNEGLEWV